MFGISKRQVLFWIALIGAIFYNSYRYPLQINFSGTSPTYSDTPFYLQIGKYIFLLLITLAGFFSIRAPRRSGESKLFFTGVAFIFLVGAARGAAFQQESFFLVGLIPLLACLILLSTRGVKMDLMGRFLGFCILVSLVVNAVQIFLFYTTGRLPALAYEDSLSVRFGSFLDDPNGFAALSFLFIGWLISEFSFRNFLLLVGIIVCVFFTQSATAIVYLGLGCVFLAFSGTGRYRSYALILAVFVCIVAGIYLETHWQDLMELVELKQGSVEVHASLLDVFQNYGAAAFLFGSTEEIFSESWWIYSLRNHGIIFTGIFLFVCLIPVFSAKSQLKNAPSIDQKRFLVAYLVFALYFLIGSANLPFPLIFPINFVYFILGALIVTKRAI